MRTITVTKARKDTGKTLPRVFVYPEGETILENLFARRQRPYSVYRREILPEVWDQLGVSNAKVRWSQYAGCTCPCSPGFVVTEGYRGDDLIVTVSE
jgi:hypothetical protein